MRRLTAWIMFGGLLLCCAAGSIIVHGPVAAPSGSYNLSQNLVAHWSLNESSDGSAQVDRVDSVGSLTLTDVNTTPSAAGHLGNAASFAAANSESLDGADWAAVDFSGDVSFVISAWVNLTTKSSDRSIVTKWRSSAGNRQYQLHYSSAVDRFRLTVRDADDVASVDVDANSLGSPSTGVWYNVVCWRDATINEIGIAVNNGTANTAAQTQGIRDTGNAFYIGRNFGGAHMNGLIDQVRIYNIAPSAALLSALYAE